MVIILKNVKLILLKKKKVQTDLVIYLIVTTSTV